MKESRRTEPNPPLFKKYIRLLKGNRGVLGMNSEEALVYWITALQQHAAECEFGTNADPTDIAPRLFVYGMKGCAGMYAEVDVFKDDPSRVLSEEWSPIELRAD